MKEHVQIDPTAGNAERFGDKVDLELALVSLADLDRLVEFGNVLVDRVVVGRELGAIERILDELQQCAVQDEHLIGVCVVAVLDVQQSKQHYFFL